MTLSEMATKVLRNIQIPEDGSTAAVQALTDAKSYLNERARDIWKRRVWREYLTLGTYSVPANTYTIALASITPLTGFSAFAEISGVREGDTALMPQDAMAVNSIKPDAWEQTTNPVRFVNLGANGIRLLGYWATATTLSFIGKCTFTEMADGDSWTLGNGECLVAGATADMIRDHDRDNNRAALRYQEYEAEIVKLVDACELQAGNEKRIVPVNPWTLYMDGYGTWPSSTLKTM